MMELLDAMAGFSVLAQETRLEVMRTLLRKGPGGVPAGWLAEAFAVPKPTMSFHLKELVNAGLIRARRKGRSIIYAPDYGGLRALVDFLLTDCCQGDPRLCGPYVMREESKREPGS